MLNLLLTGQYDLAFLFVSSFNVVELIEVEDAGGAVGPGGGPVVGSMRDDT